MSTKFLEETIKTKKIFLDWSNVSTLLGEYSSFDYVKQSFYSLDVYKHIERPEETDIFINKVLLPFLYYSISEHQKDESERGSSMIYNSGVMVNYSFFYFLLIF